jgi:hypothetical protein
MLMRVIGLAQQSSSKHVSSQRQGCPQVVLQEGHKATHELCGRGTGKDNESDGRCASQAHRFHPTRCEAHKHSGCCFETSQAYKHSGCFFQTSRDCHSEADGFRDNNDSAQQEAINTPFFLLILSG